MNIIGTIGSSRIGIMANTEATIAMTTFENNATQVVACNNGVGA